MHIRKINWLGLHGECTGILTAMNCNLPNIKTCKKPKEIIKHAETATPPANKNANSITCKRSIDKNCRGNVLCRSVTDCKRNHIMLKMQTCGLQPMLLTPRHIKLACIFCIYALALEAGPQRWKICPPLPACALYGWIKTLNKKKLRRWQHQFLTYVAGNNRKCGNTPNKVWHVVDDVQNK